MTVSIGLGLFLWIVDAVLDYVIFYKGTFFELLIANVPAPEVYSRLVVIVCFFVFGTFVSGIVAKREQAEKALEESEERFAVFMDYLPASVFIKDKDSRVLYVNRHMKDFFNAETWVGQTATEYLPTKAAKAMIAEDQKALTKGPIAKVEPVIGKDGIERVYQTVKFLIEREDKPNLLGGIALDITERVQAEEAFATEREALRKRTHDLGKRVKELNCLYAISSLVEEPSIPLEEILKDVVDLLPPAWQYPEIACARIVLGDNEFKTKNFEVTTWRQVSDIVVHGEPSGTVEVCYLEEGPTDGKTWEDEGPFVQEERALINAIAEQLGKIIERMQAEEAVWQHTERLSILYAIDQAILEAQSSEAIAEAALQRIGQLVPCMVAAVTEFDLKADTAITLAQYHKAMGIGSIAGPRSAVPCLSLEGIENIIERLRQGRIQVVENIQSSDPLPPAIQALEATGVRSYISAPLIVKEELIGSLDLGSHHPAAFTPEHVEIAREVATQLAVALQQARLREQVERHAAELEQRVADRTRELQTLYDVTAVASESLDLEAVLEQSLEQSLASVRCQAGAIYLLDESNGATPEETLQLAVWQGEPPHITALVDPSLEDRAGLVNWVVEHGEPLVVPDMSLDPRIPHQVRANVPFPYVGVSIRAKGKVVGGLGMVGGEGQQFSAEDVALLVSIADHVAVAVENARLRQQAEYAAVVEERGRLARELHDSVTQLLYSLGLYAETGQRLAGSGEIQGAQDYLGRIGRAAQQALKEMRMLIYELRPPVLEEVGLVGALQQRLDAVERRAGVESALLTEGVLELPATVESDFYYVAQEALNNALKHAAATSVEVYIRADDDCVELEVVDDGVGFDPDATGDTGGIGQSSMRERAKKLGGKLDIISAPGEGTRVKLVVSNS